jgi:PAS domain S-box-containing protein
VLACSLALTYAGWRSARAEAERELQDYFDFRVRDAESRIAERMHAYEQVLRGAAGLLAHADRVERGEFRRYVEALRLEDNYPGAQGVGFSSWIPPLSKDRHTLEVRREGFPNYSIHPDSQRDHYTSIIYLEPFAGRNLLAFGFDMFSDPVRRDAMERARDSGRPALSGKVPLLQETDPDVQSGVLLYMPVYRRGGYRHSIAERRSDLVGWVFSPFRMDDLMQGVLGERASDLDVEIFDGEETSPATLMYDGDEILSAADQRLARFVAERKLEIGGRRWTVQFRSMPGLEDRLNAEKPRIVVQTGVAASLLLALLTVVLASARARAIRAARQLNEDLALLTKAEEALRASEAKFRSYAEKAPHALIVVDRSGRYVDFNPAALELLAYDAPTLLAKSLLELVVEDDHETAHHDFACVAAGGEVEGEYRFRRGDGRVVDVLLRGVKVADDQLMAFCQDITARKEAEAALRRSEKRFRDLIEALPIGVFVGRGGKIIYANRTFATHLGYPHPAAMVGRGPSELLAPEHRDDGLRSVQREDQPYRPLPPREWRWVRADGGFVTLEASATREIVFDGKPAILWTVRDLTELKTMQSRLMQSDRLASVGMLAAGVAHEINNPLAYAISALDFLGKECEAFGRRLPGEDLAEIKEALLEAREGTERVRHVVRDLKTFSRGDEERRSLVELWPVLESSINMVAHEIRYRARVVKEQGKAPPVTANEARLGQVFLNLLVNAAQAIPEGHADVNEIRVATSTDELGRAVVEIRDSGSGIPEEKLSRIFDPFFTTKPVGVGTGLGLTICQNIVAALGGEIAVRSKVGEGTVVRVALPPASTGPREEAPPRKAVKEGKRGRVLVVDDEQAIGHSIRRLLSAEYQVSTCAGAEEALQLIARGERFDVILCDLMMPRMTGMDLHAELTRIAPDQAERIIVLTGGAFTARAAQFLASAPVPRLEKPFDSLDLRSAVRERCG